MNTKKLLANISKHMKDTSKHFVFDNTYETKRKIEEIYTNIYKTHYKCDVKSVDYNRETGIIDIVFIPPPNMINIEFKITDKGIEKI